MMEASAADWQDWRVRERITDARFLQHAFDIIPAAVKATTLTELNTLFRPALHDLGFTLFAVLKLSNPDGRIHLRVLFGDGTEPWLSHYTKMGYAPADKFVAECFKTTEPFIWSDIVRRGDLSPQALHVVQDAGAFGLHQGLVAPVRKPDGSIFAVLFAGETFDCENPYSLAASHLLASYYRNLGSHLYAQAPIVEERCLRVRQIECLKWVRAGKSSTEIGEIIGISRRTADEHIANACLCLGVRTRAQALTAATLAGYFDL